MKKDEEAIIWFVKPWEISEIRREYSIKNPSSLGLEEFKQQINSWNSEITFIDFKTYISTSKDKVQNPDTIHPLSGNPQDVIPSRGGLFDSNIFGEDTILKCCQCKKIFEKIQACDVCGCDEMLYYTKGNFSSYIDLANPVFHPWFLDIISSFFTSPEKIKQLLHYHIYIVEQPDERNFCLDHSISMDEYLNKMPMAISGASAVKKLLQNLSVEEIPDPSLVDKFNMYNKYFDLLVFDVLPVVPTRFRPIKRIFKENDYSKMSIGGINNIYRRIIHRNNRLKRLKELNAPELITINEKRMLQEAVDALFINDKGLKHDVFGLKQPAESFMNILSPLKLLSNDMQTVLTCL